MDKTASSQYVMFLDRIERPIFGIKVSETKDTFVVENPVVVSVQVSPNDPHQLKVQLLPIVFQAFYNSPSASSRCVYNKNNITLVEIYDSNSSTVQPYAAQLIEHYVKIFTPVSNSTASTSNNINTNEEPDVITIEN